MKASEVDGIPLNSRPFLAKRSFLHLLTGDILLVRWYSSNTNFSIDAEWLIISSNFGSNEILEREVVSSPKSFHVFHANVFPIPTENKTGSHPVNAYGRYFDFSGLTAAVIVCISRYLKCLANESSNNLSCSNTPIDIAIASVSSV